MRVVPGSRRSAVAGRHLDGWRVRVAAPPADGRANAELVRFLAELLGLPRAAVRVTAGAGSRDKTVRVEGVSRSRLEQAMADAVDT